MTLLRTCIEQGDCLTYQPKPISTANVTLTAEYLKLTEVLARNIHEIWAKHQFDLGWSQGSQYSEIDRQHPYLIPYDELPAAEKQSRRLAILETLKTLLALGYRVEASDAANLSLSLEDQDLAGILQGLKTSSELNLASLLALRRETIRLQPRTPDIYRALGDAILQLGEPLMAYDVLAEGLKYWPTDLQLQQLLALSLARSGATVAANSLLLKLVQSGQQDEETLGLLARTHKDLWLQAVDPEVRDRQLQLATERYQQAYQLNRSAWTGINAATLAMINGQVEQAKSLAHKVREDCLQKLSNSFNRSSDDYWQLATLGEAALILGEGGEAETFYGQAVEVGQGRFGDLSSSRRNAMLLAKHLEIDSQQIKQWFQVPRVVVFCGHRIDHPDRPQPRFPAHLEPKVYRAICDRLHQLNARLGYSLATCGSDILFLEAIREMKGELHIVLPYDREQFIRDSVDIIPGANWKERFEQLMQQATEVIIASNRKLQEGNVVYEYSNRLLHGLAKMRAEQLGTDLVPLTVWDGKPGDGQGTANNIAFWQQWAEQVEVIDLEALLHSSPLRIATAGSISTQQFAAPALATPLISTPTLTIERQIRALLFADVVHYSQLEESQYLPFVEHFLGAIADLSSQPNHPPLLKNTWGDALYFVFLTVKQAGQFALNLCDLIQSIDWSSRGLPEQLNLRIALHAGPVDRNVDPITGQVNYIGTHVTHTARIEPITPPGKVYASQAFAAIAASEGLKSFTCDYVGQMPWAKHYGTFPTYHVRRCVP
ncbi:TRAFs-binding domain-containing protein [Kovacikia minuta CCNUW1]|uniref:TRAFs-binding domain-containing protein n=1 Tax=Kovacikia minuta TaxID=2931930 RepID=UPI001CCC19CC|nr:TRAFs-binding domain-containing protein [Kovacikia minuta]UBF29090.1 TRAFs-binding domain-containing protein [Kovacikia minuta CCNUW1]